MNKHFLAVFIKIESGTNTNAIHIKTHSRLIRYRIGIQLVILVPYLGLHATLPNETPALLTRYLVIGALRCLALAGGLRPVDRRLQHGPLPCVWVGGREVIKADSAGL